LFADERVTNLATLKKYAERARRLANPADPSTHDPSTQRRFLDLAREYEAQIETIQHRAHKSQ
jgi:hypothetical protein